LINTLTSARTGVADSHQSQLVRRVAGDPAQSRHSSNSNRTRQVDLSPTDRLQIIKMDMSMSMSDSMFASANASMARTYWYIIAAVLGCTVLLQVVDFVQTSIRLVHPELQFI
jgi:hypothetical protein